MLADHPAADAFPQLPKQFSSGDSGQSLRARGGELVMKSAGLFLQSFGDYFLFGNVFDALAIVQFAIDDHRISREMLLVRHRLVHALERNAEWLFLFFFH